MTEARDVDRARLEGHVALLAVQLFFGLLPIFGKWAFEAFSPRAVASWRIVAGALVLGLLAFARHGRGALPSRGDLLRLQLCAFLGIVLNQLLYLEGLRRSTAVEAGLIIAMIPVFTFLIATLVRQERFQGRRGLGILVAFGGTFLLLQQEGLDPSSSHLQGNLLMIVNVLSYSIYLVLSRPLTRRLPPLVVIAWVFGLSVWTVPFFAVGEVVAPSGVAARPWISLACVIVFPTILAYMLNLFALARVPASTVAVYVFLQPVIAGIAGVLLLGESLREGTVLAALAILGGLALVVWKRN